MLKNRKINYDFGRGVHESIEKNFEILKVLETGGSENVIESQRKMEAFGGEGNENDEK